MMGSAEELPQAPSERPKFIEDMSEAEAAAAVSGVCVCVGGGVSSVQVWQQSTHTFTHAIIAVISANWSGELW